jgi:hypothetical protein
MFYDAGAAWNLGEEVRARRSVGFGLHGDDPDDDWFVTLAFPLKSSEFKPVLTIGVRIGGGF